ncbi:MAG: 4Fe-4S binding protein [Elusimicrobiales bacterium]|nr:4Fe-4S binding protein [Elusimicrobiales bacterium]
MASKNYAEVSRERCVSCGACTQECPMNAIHIWKGCFAVVDPSVCVGCGKCKKVCPADCIDIKPREAIS